MPTIKESVQTFIDANPDGTYQECAEILGLNQKTVQVYFSNMKGTRQARGPRTANPANPVPSRDARFMPVSPVDALKARLATIHASLGNAEQEHMAACATAESIYNSAIEGANAKLEIMRRELPKEAARIEAALTALDYQPEVKTAAE